ncbi:MAG: hypothetical protein NXI31_13960 [bacterium]|nr:hypothetical protein [bacterium]
MISKPHVAAALLVSFSATSLTTDACAQSPLVAFGLDHEAIGQANLNPTPAGLVVSNLGSSGQDGVRMHVGGAGWDGFVTPTPLQPGDVTECIAIGSGGGLTNVSVASLRFSNPGTGILLEAAVETASSYTVEAYLDGVLVHRRTGVESPTDREYVPIWDGIPTPSSDIHWDFSNGLHGDATFDQPVSLQYGTGPNVVCDLIRVRPEDSVLPALELSQVELLSNVNVTIENERVVTNGHAASAIGSVGINPTVAGLTVSNLGSSGRDGIRLSPAINERQDGIDVRWSPLPDPSSLPFGRRLTIGGTGRTTTGTTQLLGEVQIENLTPDVQLSFDYSTMGATGFHIRVYNGGTLAGSATVTTQGFVLASQWPEYACVLRPDVDPFCNYTCWATPSQLLVLDNGATYAYVGDEIHVVPQGTPNTLRSIESLTLTSNVTNTLQITGIHGVNDPALQTIGTSCETSSGFAPLNVSSTVPFLGTTWDGQITNLRSETSLVFVAIGLDRINPGLPLDSFGMPGCTQYVAPLATLVFPTSGASSVTYSQTIPNDPGMAGLPLFVQAIANGAANAVTFATTNAVGVVVQ